eukprot:360331-Chlamydomonas_euryale.AAC.11
MLRPHMTARRDHHQRGQRRGGTVPRTVPHKGAFDRLACACRHGSRDIWVIGDACCGVCWPHTA